MSKIEVRRKSGKVKKNIEEGESQKRKKKEKEKIKNKMKKIVERKTIPKI